MFFIWSHGRPLPSFLSTAECKHGQEEVKTQKSEFVEAEPAARRSISWSGSLIYWVLLLPILSAVFSSFFSGYCFSPFCCFFCLYFLFPTGVRSVLPFGDALRRTSRLYLQLIAGGLKWQNPLPPKQHQYPRPCQQHPEFPSGLPSKYYPVLMLLDGTAASSQPILDYFQSFCFFAFLTREFIHL